MYISDDEEEGTESPKKKKRKLAPIRYVENRETGAIDVHADGYFVKGFFKRHWGWRKEPQEPEDDSQSNSESDKTSGQTAKQSKTGNEGGEKQAQSEEFLRWGVYDHFLRCEDGTSLDARDWDSEDYYKSPGRPVQLSRLISTPLLSYRLTAVFGMPPATDYLDHYKETWSATLRWKLGEGTSYLNFGEHKGAPSFSFYGTQSASKCALKLVKYLASNNVPHPYEYVLAGNIA